MPEKNPWLELVSSKPPAVSVESPTPPEAAASASVATLPEVGDLEPAVLTGPSGPQPHVSAPSVSLPSRRVVEAPSIWLVGAHGGAGETTLAMLSEDWMASEHAWPQPANVHGPACCVLVARTHTHGLLAAQRALQQWASGGTAVELLGLALVADAPGRLPAPLRDLAKVIGGGAPRVWHVPWVEAWRFDGPASDAPRAVRKTVEQIKALVRPNNNQGGQL